MSDKALAIYMVLCLLKKYKDKFKRSLDGRTRLQKMVFLLGEEYGLKFFEYTPYYYGPYSFDLRDLLDELKFYGLVVEEAGICGYYYDITDEGIKYLEILGMRLKKHDILGDKIKEIEKSVEDIMRRFGKSSRKQIIDYVYSKYKDYVPKRVNLPW